MPVNYLMRSALGFLIAYAGLVGVTHPQDIAVANATVYTSPDAAAQLHTTVLIKGGKIVAVGNGVSVPPGVQTLPCRGCVVFAGFWNTHVHFTGPEWNDASKIPASKLTQQMQAMLTHSGFATVVDTSSDPSNTAELGRRIEIGNALGPRIYTAGFGLYPPHGIPYYLDDLPASLLAKLPQPETPAAAIGAVQQNVALDLLNSWRTTDCSAIQHILHRHVFDGLFMDQCHECITETFARALYALIGVTSRLDFRPLGACSCNLERSFLD